MARAQKKFHFIYKTTCRVNGKWYIGMHSTDDLNDGYIGSGKRLWYSINKYGRDQFDFEILEYCETRELLHGREAELVNKITLLDPLCLNMKAGGEGGGILYEKNKSNGFHRMGYDAMMQIKDPSKAAKKAAVTRLMNGTQRKFSVEASRKGCQAAASEAANIKRIETLKSMGHSKGVKNSQFGSMWITDGSCNQKIKKDAPIPDGWSRGRR